MTTRGSYVHKTYDEILGASQTCYLIFCCCKFLNKSLMVSDKTIHKASRIHQNSINKTHFYRDLFYVHYLPKPYTGLICFVIPMCLHSCNTLHIYTIRYRGTKELSYWLNKVEFLVQSTCTYSNVNPYPGRIAIHLLSIHC